MSPIDSPSQVDESIDLPFAKSASDLAGRQTELPAGHPSSPGSRGQPDGGSETYNFRHLTDRDYAEHVGYVEDRLADARARNLTSDVRHTTDSGGEVWSDERDAAHHSIIEHLYAAAADVPREGKAILAGGLPGAGKTTILAAHAGIDLSQYLMINPDLIKEELAHREMVPQIAGLSPMEASDLVHEESSYLAKRLASRAEADSKNVIWDVTMSRTDTAIERIESLRSAGYARVEGIFVDIPIGASLRRSASRHREDHEEYRAGKGLGGRHISTGTILDHADSAWSSGNRRNFEELKPRFDIWRVYDNSADGGVPTLVAAHVADLDRTDGHDGADEHDTVKEQRS